MSDTPGPWRRNGREHFQRCGDMVATVSRATAGYLSWYRWTVRPAAPPPREPVTHANPWETFAEPDGTRARGAADTLAAAKRAATAALIRHAPMPF